MMRARWLLLGGASFATLAAFTIGASAIARTPAAVVPHSAWAGSHAHVSRRAASPVVARADVGASRRATAFITSGVLRASAEEYTQPRTFGAGGVPHIPSQTVTGVSPNGGASGSGGEQSVTITGSGFTGATDVFFGSSTDVSSSNAYPCLSSPAGCFTVSNDNQIIADTPVESAGTVDVTVDTTTVNPPQDQYSYFDPPTVATVASPQPQGATGIAVTGTNFSYPGVTPFASGVSEVDLVPTGGGSTVAITNVCGGGSPPNCFLATDDTHLSIDLPNSMSSGQYDTEVITPGGTSATSTNDLLTVQPPAPTLTTLNPSSGSTVGGINVTLTGTNLTGATDVHWGGLDIAVCGTGTCFTVDSDTQITVDNIPSGAAGGVTVNVVTPSGPSNNKTYTYVTPTPTLTLLNPSSGSTVGGINVTLTGTNFTGATAVNWGGSVIPLCGTGTCYTVDSDTQITVDNIPSGAAGGVTVNVVTPSGPSNNKTYTYVTPTPTLTLLNPTSGSTAGGNGVTLTGTNFTGATHVHVGSSDLTPCPSAPCFHVDTDTQITVTMPANLPGNVSINVTTPGGTTGSLQYTYDAPTPSVTRVSPNNGPLGGTNSVSLTGTDFEAAGTPIVSQVTVDLTPPVNISASPPCATPPTSPCFTVHSPTSITIGYMPAGTGQVNITVTTQGGISPATSSNIYTYNPAAPAVTKPLLPKFGSTAGDEAISLFGSGFGQAGQDFVSDVYFGSVDVPSSNSYPCPTSSAGCFIVVGPGQLAIYTPANSAGTVDVEVMTTLGRSLAVAVDKYTFVPPGAYTAVTPYRACDTRPPGGGIVQNQCDMGTNHTLGANGIVTAQITQPAGPVPTGAQAVVVNVTAIDHSSGITLVTAYPAGTGRPVASNINLAGNTVESNLVIVQLSQAGGTVPAGAITLYNALGSADVIVDVEGYFSSPPGGGSHAGEFHSIPPLRICDSRANMGTECAGTVNNPLLAGKWRDVVLSGLPHGAPVGTPSIPSTPGTAAAAVFNLTGTNGTLPTLLAVAPALANHLCPTASPAFSNLNPSAGIALAIRVISKLGPNQDVCLFSPVGSINFITDVNGWFGSSTAPAGVLFYSIPPTRVCDTRPTSGYTCSLPAPGLTPTITKLIGIAGAIAVPADDQHSVEPAAMVANLTGVAGTANTVFILYPSDKARSGTSDLNPSAHQVIANLAIVGLSTTPSTNNGDVSLYNGAGDINAVLDVAGWFQ